MESTEELAKSTESESSEETHAEKVQESELETPGKKRRLEDDTDEEQPEKRPKTDEQVEDMKTEDDKEKGERDEQVKVKGDQLKSDGAKVATEGSDEQNKEKDQQENKEKPESDNKQVDNQKTESKVNGIGNGKTDKGEADKTEGEKVNGEEPMDLDIKGADKNAKSEDGASVHSDDSEKENRNTEMPMDLSAPMDLSTKTSKSSTPAQDGTVMSDESDYDENGIRMNGRKDIIMDEKKLRQKMIKRLQAELRNEEAKLVLLKKLRVSQMSHQMQNMSGKSQPNQHQSQPPPLVRGGNQAPQQQQQQAKPAHSQPPQLSRPGSQPTQNGNKSQGPPPLVMAPHMDQRQLIQNQMKLLQQQQQQLSKSSNNLTNYRGSQSQAEANRQPPQPRVPEETPAQRQAAAKLALRKQLEKTLLQIPPPKPPPPEMNFIPNLASPDFVYLLGLEEAVNHIIDTNLISKGRKNPAEKMVCNPFTCVQCGTDFTPVWKREKPGSKNVICEQCVTTNQKKALKQEHTNRLKSAFVKALQQEQEIERMQSQEAKNAPPTSSNSTKEKTEQRERETSRESPVTTSSRSASQAYKESMAETIRQHHNLLQAHQAAALRMGQPLGMQGFNPRAPFPYQLPFAARASDLQRQYLLDMIPKGGLPWNS